MNNMYLNQYQHDHEQLFTVVHWYLLEHDFHVEKYAAILAALPGVSMPGHRQVLPGHWEKW
jgi:predicted nucleotidyltransferase